MRKYPRYSQQQTKWYPLKKFMRPILKLHSNIAVANLVAHKNLWLCYYVQVSLLRLKKNVAAKWASKHLWGVPFILLLTALKKKFTYSNIEAIFVNNC